MSVLLLTNPFVSQQSPPPPAIETSGGDAGSSSVGEPVAVSPAQSGNESANGGSSTAFSGSGSGAGGSAAQQPVTNGRTSERPQNAAPNSIVAAQAEAYATLTRPLDHDAAHRSVIALMETRRAVALIDGVKAVPDVLDLSPTRSKVPSDMPNPIPTSPFLKGAQED